MDLYRLILVDPQDARNIGMVARLCANFDVNDIYVVSSRQIEHTEARRTRQKDNFNPVKNPKASKLQQQHTQQAVPTEGSPELMDISYWKRSTALATKEGLPFLEGMKVVATLAEALIGCERAVAFTGKSGKNFRTHDTNVLGIPDLMSTTEGSSGMEGKERAKMALVFGREDFGLSTNDLLLCRHTCTLPTSQHCSSLNMAMSVSVVLFTLFSNLATNDVMDTTQSTNSHEGDIHGNQQHPITQVDSSSSTSDIRLLPSNKILKLSPKEDLIGQQGEEAAQSLASDAEIGQSMEEVRVILEANGYPVGASDWTGQARRRNKLAFRVHKHWAIIGRLLQRAQATTDEILAFTSIAHLLATKKPTNDIHPSTMIEQ